VIAGGGLWEALSRNFLGKTPSEEMIKLFMEAITGDQTPPTFLTLCQDSRAGTGRCSMILKAHSEPAEYLKLPVVGMD
jgi:hypothetical protein